MHKLIFFLRYEYRKKDPLSIDYYGYKVYFQKGDGSINHLSKGYGYENDLIRTASFLIRKNAVIFDIGASLGLISLALLAKHSEAAFHCFEPSPYPYKYLLKTIKVNKLENNIILNKTALFNRKGKIPFFVHLHKDALGDGLIDTKRAGKAYQIYVKTMTLDEYVVKNKISTINLIKVDVEGAELAVFKGGLNTLKKFRPFLIFEANPKNMSAYNIKPPDIFRYLTDLNYFICDLKRKKLNEDEFINMTVKIDNYLAIPR